MRLVGRDHPRQEEVRKPELALLRDSMNLRLGRREYNLRGEWELMVVFWRLKFLRKFVEVLIPLNGKFVLEQMLWADLTGVFLLHG